MGVVLNPLLNISGNLWPLSKFSKFVQDNHRKRLLPSGRVLEHLDKGLVTISITFPRIEVRQLNPKNVPDLFRKRAVLQSWIRA